MNKKTRANIVKVVIITMLLSLTIVLGYNIIPKESIEVISIPAQTLKGVIIP